MYDKLTENDIKKMQEEIDYRKLVVRPKELEAVKEARAQGDLSENFEYKAAKQDKNRNESRKKTLQSFTAQPDPQCGNQQGDHKQSEDGEPCSHCIQFLGKHGNQSRKDDHCHDKQQSHQCSNPVLVLELPEKRLTHILV